VGGRGANLKRGWAVKGNLKNKKGGETYEEIGGLRKQHCQGRNFRKRFLLGKTKKTGLGVGTRRQGSLCLGERLKGRGGGVFGLGGGLTVGGKRR